MIILAGVLLLPIINAIVIGLVFDKVSETDAPDCSDLRSVQ